MKIKNMKTREQKDKAAKKGKQSLWSVTRRFRNFSISKIDLTPPLPTLTPILAQWWIWRPSHARTMPRQNVKRYINSQVERVFLAQYHYKVKSFPYLISETDQTVCPSDYGGADKGSHQKRRYVSSGVNSCISLMLTIIQGKCDFV